MRNTAEFPTAAGRSAAQRIEELIDRATDGGIDIGDAIERGDDDIGIDVDGHVPGPMTRSLTEGHCRSDT